MRRPYGLGARQAASPFRSLVLIVIAGILSSHPGHARLMSEACNGFGVQRVDGSCTCLHDYSGDHCEFRLSTHEYVGKRECVHGVKTNQGCECSIGWVGALCELSACEHGIQGCPGNAHYCERTVCNCDDGWEGERCSQQTTSQKPLSPESELEDLSEPPTTHSTPTSQQASSQPPRDHHTNANPNPNPNTHTKSHQPTQDTCDLHCANGGTRHTDPCHCSCPDNWRGPTCSECPAQDCAHGGSWNSETCECTCPPPWSPSDHCATCPFLDCANGAEFDTATCSCKCLDHWTGTTCNVCPSLAELTVRGVTCGARGFSRSSCACNTSCPPITCLNGGRQDPHSCLCHCNAKASDDHHDGEQDREEKDSDEREEEEDGGESSHSRRHRRHRRGSLTTAPPRGSDQELPSQLSLLQTASSEFNSFMAKPSSSHATPPSASVAIPLAPVLPPWVLTPHKALLTVSSETTSFWDGATCESCNPPHDNACPPTHSWDSTRCSCVPVCPKNVCANGGTPVILETTRSQDSSLHHNESLAKRAKTGEIKCGCQCFPPWSGGTCQTRGTGATPVSAARSCLAILRARPSAGSGRYWLNPSGVAPLENAFEAYCDMNEDGGGWVELARVGQHLRHQKLDKNTYLSGTWALKGLEFVLPCGQFTGMDGVPHRGENRAGPANVIVRVTMGAVRDYFRPVQTAALCDMLTSHKLHEWAPEFSPSMLEESSVTAVASDSQQLLRFRAGAHSAASSSSSSSASASASASSSVSAATSSATSSAASDTTTRSSHSSHHQEHHDTAAAHHPHPLNMASVFTADLVGVPPPGPAGMQQQPPQQQLPPSASMQQGTLPPRFVSRAPPMYDAYAPQGGYPRYQSPPMQQQQRPTAPYMMQQRQQQQQQPTPFQSMSQPMWNNAGPASPQYSPSMYQQRQAPSMYQQRSLQPQYPPQMQLPRGGGPGNMGGMAGGMAPMGLSPPMNPMSTSFVQLAQQQQQQQPNLRGSQNVNTVGGTSESLGPGGGAAATGVTRGAGQAFHDWVRGAAAKQQTTSDETGSASRHLSTAPDSPRLPLKPLPRVARSSDHGDVHKDVAGTPVGSPSSSFVEVASAEVPPARWVIPSYIDDVMNPALATVLGGSRKQWPVAIDGRMYLSIWGGHRGGCCHNRSRIHPGVESESGKEDSAKKQIGADDGGWRRGFSIHVIEVDPALYQDGNDFQFAKRRDAADSQESSSSSSTSKDASPSPPSTVESHEPQRPPSHGRYKDELDPMEHVG